jgi:K+-sensing histidine kinase KdpD
MDGTRPSFRHPGPVIRANSQRSPLFEGALLLTRGAPSGMTITPARTKADLLVVHVVSGEDQRRSSPEAIERLRQLASDVGGTWQEVVAEDVAAALLDMARQHQVTQVVVGASRRSRLEEPTRGSVVQKLLRASGQAGVDVHVIAPRPSSAGKPRSGSPAR